MVDWTGKDIVISLIYRCVCFAFVFLDLHFLVSTDKFSASCPPLIINLMKHEKENLFLSDPCTTVSLWLGYVCLSSFLKAKKCQKVTFYKTLSSLQG